MKKGMIIMFVTMVLSLVVVAMWDKFPIIGNTVNSILDPTFGKIMEWNLILGFVVVVFVLSFLLTIIQKYTTDQPTMKQLKVEQKALSDEMKKFRDNPQKILELQKKQFEIIPKTFDITMKPIIFTFIPLILLFRWFGELLEPVWGGWWILYYIILFMIFSIVWRKMLDVA